MKASKPAKTDPELLKRDLCDQIVDRAARMMLDEVRVDLPTVFDRLVVFVSAHATVNYGAVEAAKLLRHAADQIDAGTFDKLRERH